MKNYDKLYRYVHGELDESELWEFKKSLETDVELIKEYNEFMAMHQTIGQHDKFSLLNHLNMIHQENKKKGIQRFLADYRVVAAAASIILILAVGGLMISNYYGQQSNNQLYAAYFTHENSMFSLRSTGSNIEQPVIQGIQYYEMQNFDAAVEMFEKAPDNLLGKLYGGLSFMELNEFEKAKESFNFIIQHNDNLFIDQSEWYLGLCNLKTNHTKDAITILEKIAKENSVYKTKAQKLLKELKN
ncbi:MAG: tetratricopeptide repeat protein [Bacteroidales bacterium]|nr:tetratricopeptide repeat protein [Bacteroidales bacterium]